MNAPSTASEVSIIALEPDPYRLPASIRPDHYDLTLRPDLDSAAFTGSVAIDVAVQSAVDKIVMNAIELAIDRISIDGVDVGLEAVSLDEELERLTIAVQDLAVGDHRIEIDFTGVLNDKLRGFYRSTYTDEDGQSQTLATTQFESTNARRAFPCWDEPDRKATFDVTLEVPEDLMAISCQSEVSSTPLDNGRRSVRFATTPIMSTYLLAFVVGRLEATEPRLAGGVPMRIVHPPGKGEQCQFALDAGVFAMDWLTDYFGIDYPGDKIDMIAIPDFAFGAMENLGCVTYREILLIVDPDATTQPEQQRSVDVIAHELAHMWFGDLVTMKWWNGLWLKEAFATFMEMKVTEAFRPEWQRWVDFGLSRTAAMGVDSLASTRPIEFEVVSPADAEGMYDLLTYEKGAAVVRMLEQYLGEEEFRKGASAYLRQHSFANTETHDLWDALETSSGQPVRSIMDSWIFQGGYPLVSVERNGASVTLRQNRFSYSPDVATPAPSAPAATWSVPVVLTLGSGADRHLQRVLIDHPTVTVELEVPDADWLLANTAASGFYRCGFDPDSRAALLANLDRVAAIERYGLIDDAWALVVAGAFELRDYLAIVTHFADETDLAVWKRILGTFAALDDLANPDERSAVAAALRSLAEPVLDRLGAPDPAEPDLTSELRAALFGALGTVGQSSEIEVQARAMLDAADTDTAMQAASIRVVAANGGPADFDDFARRFADADSPQEERRYLYALAQFPTSDVTERFLPMTRDGSVRSQDVAYVLGSALHNRHHQDAVWAFIKESWVDINNTCPDNSISRMLEGIRALSTAAQADDVHEFLDAHPVPQGEKTVAQHRERLDINVALRSRIAGRLVGALAAN